MVESPILRPAVIVRTLIQHRWKWLSPAFVGMLVAVAIACLLPARWQASQTLIVRNEATGAPDGPGKFRQEDEMKTTLETVMEVARSHGVVERALAEVGPDERHKAGTPWPGAADIEALRDAIQVAPPKGAEFGKTEIFSLSIEDRSRPRAVALVTAVCRQMQQSLGQIRERKAQGLVDELTKFVSLSEADLTECTQRLGDMEQQVGGSDLADLRMLDQTSVGDSDLRRQFTAIETELRDARTTEKADQELLAMLKSAQQDPGYLLAAPSRLLQSQPALARLKDGLVDAQLRKAQLDGTMTSAHPQVRAARAAEQEIIGRIRSELGTSVRGMQAELHLATGRVDLLERQLGETRQRLDRLAGLRAKYSNLSANAKEAHSRAEKARRDLIEARSGQAAARSASLIALVDGPIAGDRPAGPSRSLIAVAGLVGGLAAGLALIFLTVPWPASHSPHSAHSEFPAVHIGHGLAPVANGGAAQNLSLNQALHKFARREPRSH